MLSGVIFLNELCENFSRQTKKRFFEKLSGVTSANCQFFIDAGLSWLGWNYEN